MYPVLIGSRALNYWNNRPSKETTDWDVISLSRHVGCEIHDPLFLNNQDMTGYRSNHQIVLPDGTTAYVMSMLGLSIIKRSHLYRDLSFDKHITHYHKMGLKQALNECLSIRKSERVEIDLQNRIQLTMKAFPQGNPNLMQSVDGFFNDAVSKLYDHDWLHKLYAYNDVPMYTKMQREPTIAWCDKDIWDNFTDIEKQQCVAEECYVIATERFLVPNNWKYSVKLAFMNALNKVCTTLCSGWFRDYAIENYAEIMNMVDSKIVNRVKLVIESTPADDRHYFKGKSK